MLTTQWHNKSFEWDVGYATAPPTPLKLGVREHIMEDYSEHFDDPSFWDKLKNFAIAAGRRVVKIALTLYFCFRDPQTPMRAKAIIASALGYFILPLDAIPDLTPGVGFSDDLGALIIAAAIVAAHITPEHRRQAEEKLRDWFGDEPDADDDSGQPARAAP